MQRYFLETPLGSADHALLSGPEAHHLLHVMRAKTGALLMLFDGSGWEFSARLEKLARTTAELVITGRACIDRELPLPVELAVALPKGDRQRWLVEKAVELGVTRLVPLETEHGVAQPAAGALHRLRRAVIEASKQCGRNCLMEIAEPRKLPDLTGESFPGGRLLAHPGAASLTDVLATRGEAEPGGWRVAIGPEGGFSAGEVEQAGAQGFTVTSLGPRILRVETAALYAASAIIAAKAGLTPGG